AGRLRMIVSVGRAWQRAQDQHGRSILLSWTGRCVESVTMRAAEFRSNRSLVIVSPGRLETWMATVLLTNALSETVTFSEGRSTNRAAPSFRERSESETVTLRLLATWIPLPLAGTRGRYDWFVNQTESWANRMSEELVTKTP